MNKKQLSLFVCLLLLLVGPGFGQEQQVDTIARNMDLKFKPAALIIPGVLITYGVVGLESHGLINWNHDIEGELQENIDERMTIDDFMQYMPAASVYALNGLGIKGRHNMKDRTVILATAYVMMAATVNTFKYTSHVWRPDHSADNSFPSGHTATAFMGAEFLWQEYKEVSVWYGIGGYAVATATGFFRMYNDRHWLTDVAAGAGIGILSTKAAYWIHPWLSGKNRRGKEKEASTLLLPYYNGRQTGLSFSMEF